MKDFGLSGWDCTWARLRVVEIDVAGVAVAVVFGDGIYGCPVGEVSMLVERGHNGGVVETVALNDYGEGVHGCSHVFGVADLVGGAVHGW